MGHTDSSLELSTPFGNRVHLFSEEIAYRLIEDFTLGFSAPVGNIRHQHLSIPTEMEQEVSHLMDDFSFRKLKKYEHDYDRAPKEVPESDFLSVLIYKRFEMIPWALNKQLVGLSKKNKNPIQFGGGYSIIWKVGHLHEKDRLKELIRFLKQRGLQYQVAPHVADSLLAS
ncbi:MAG: hypothetical protein COB67_07950 [SAR324 cluster bacterium]|uniref:Uncharacterized protein n=1 Tax=SAR324 cluster bacterium TaxID=2024889 RepID=A0A2A4T3I6_9DELT|nr:MAG: hypothetical protein COB67_07950 [SAR324 cluster bacterium]